MFHSDGSAQKGICLAGRSIVEIALDVNIRSQIHTTAIKHIDDRSFCQTVERTGLGINLIITFGSRFLRLGIDAIDGDTLKDQVASDIDQCSCVFEIRIFCTHTTYKEFVLAWVTIHLSMGLGSTIPHLVVGNSHLVHNEDMVAIGVTGTIQDEIECGSRSIRMLAVVCLVLTGNTVDIEIIATAFTPYFDRDIKLSSSYDRLIIIVISSNIFVQFDGNGNRTHASLLVHEISLFVIPQGEVETRLSTTGGLTNGLADYII